jgi:Radical SAM superfamily/4Fe-4S single cluster domain
MLIGIHFLLSYTCTYECDHCFLFSSPSAEGTFTSEQIQNALEQAKDVNTLNSIYLEGGEPFLYYPVMLHSVRVARKMGFNVGIVTNCYWAVSEKDAEIWLKPLVELGLSDLSVSDDAFHYGDNAENNAKNAYRAAKKLNLPVSSICIDEPSVVEDTDSGRKKGDPVIGGNVLFKGRAVEKLTENLPGKEWEQLTECPHEDLKTPSRVHLDCYGNAQICQGLSIGNLWRTPLAELDSSYDPMSYPVISTLIQDGPAGLVREFDLPLKGNYVDACHLCFLARRQLIDKFPDTLCPNQVYGL